MNEMIEIARSGTSQGCADSGSKARLRLWLRILKVSRDIEHQLRDKFRHEFDTTLARFDVMAALDRSAQGMKMSQLSGVLKVSNGNVTGLIDRLVSDGTVERIPVADDRRAMLVRLTEKGRREFARQAREHELWINAIFGAVSESGANRLAANLTAIGDKVSEKDGRPS